MGENMNLHELFEHICEAKYRRFHWLQYSVATVAAPAAPAAPGIGQVSRVVTGAVITSWM